MAIGPANGPPVVLFHGVGRRWQDYGPLLAVLNTRWQVHAVDHRGHSRSSRADRYLVPECITDASMLVRSLPDPPVMIGHSLGALTSLRVAALVPQQVRGVILEDSPSAGFLERIDETAYATRFRAMRNLAGGSRRISAVARDLDPFAR